MNVTFKNLTYGHVKQTAVDLTSNYLNVKRREKKCVKSWSLPEHEEGIVDSVNDFWLFY